VLIIFTMSAFGILEYIFSVSEELFPNTTIKLNGFNVCH
jgi:hypothetical protein